MAIQFVGAQRFRRSAGNSLPFGGWTRMTLLAWFRLDAAVSTPNDVVLFGREYSQQCSLIKRAGATGAMQMRLQRPGTTNDPANNAYFNFTAVTGNGYCLIVTYDEGIARAWLNRQSLGTRSLPGALTENSWMWSIGNRGLASGAAVPAGLTTTLGPFACWHDWTPSEAEREAMAYREADLMTIAGKAPFGYWPMEGPVGEVAHHSHAGVQNQGSSSAANLSATDGEPLYADQLVMPDPPVITDARVGRYGRSIAIRLLNPNSGNFAAVTTTAGVVGPLDVSIDGGEPVRTIVSEAPIPKAAMRYVTGGIQGDARYWLRYFLPEGVRVLPGQSVSLSTPSGEGWVRADGLDAMPVTNHPVANLVGVSEMEPVPAGPKVARAGLNLGGVASYAPTDFYANLVRSAVDNYPNWFYGAPIASRDPATGWPSFAPGQTGSAILQSKLDMQVFLPGHYFIRWEGPGSIDVNCPSSNATRTVIGNGTIGETKWRRVRINPPAGGEMLLGQLLLNVTGQTSNVHVYGPGVYDPDLHGDEGPPGSPLIHPEIVERCRNMEVIRFLNVSRTNFNQVATVDQLPNPNWWTHDDTVIAQSLVRRIDKVEPYPYTVGGQRHIAANLIPALVTLSGTAPHGLSQGHWLDVGFPDPLPTIGLRNSQTGETAVARLQPANVHIVNEMQVAIGLHPNDPATASGGLWHVDGEQVPSRTTTARVTINPYVPWEHMAILCGEVAQAHGHPCDPWLNIPYLADDACVREIARRVMTNLPVGHKCYVEYDNELWNYFRVFARAHDYMDMLAAKWGINRERAYVRRSGQVQQIFREEATAAGHQASAIIAVIAGQASGTSLTGRIVAACIAEGVTPDLYATAPYYTLRPSEPDAFEFYRLIDAEQLLESAELGISNYKTHAHEHASIVRASFPSAKFGCYESGFDRMPPTPSERLRAHRQHVADISLEAMKHPQAAHLFMRYYANLAASGDLDGPINHYRSDGDLDGDNPPPAPTFWAHYQATGQRPGPGTGAARPDGTLGFDNLESGPDEFHKHDAVRAYGPILWNAGYGTNGVDFIAPGIPTPDPPPDPTPDPPPDPTPGIGRIQKRYLPPRQGTSRRLW